jgi:pyridoxamine 5'-phosphate oxidase
MISSNQNPKVIFDNIKDLLNIGAKDRNHTFHTPVFSSNTEINSINSRIIVLRKFNEKNLTLNFNTDYRSPKIKELKKNNESIFVFYDSKLKIQLRIKCITKIHNKDDTTKEVWKQTPLSSRKCYLTQKPPSSVSNIPEDGISDHLKGIDPTQDESEIGYINFSVIENKIKEIDWLYLASSGHRRLKIICDNNKQVFEWIIP